jgi:hypothetical protein
VRHPRVRPPDIFDLPKPAVSDGREPHRRDRLRRPARAPRWPASARAASSSAFARAAFVASLGDTRFALLPEALHLVRVHIHRLQVKDTSQGRVAPSQRRRCVRASPLWHPSVEINARRDGRELSDPYRALLPASAGTDRLRSHTYKPRRKLCGAGLGPGARCVAAAVSAPIGHSQCPPNPGTVPAGRLLRRRRSSHILAVLDSRLASCMWRSTPKLPCMRPFLHNHGLSAAVVARRGPAPPLAARLVLAAAQGQAWLFSSSCTPPSTAAASS